MKNYEEIIGEAARVEYSEIDGRLYIVFEITNEKYKQSIKKDWLDDIEFRIIGKNLVKEEK